MSDEPRLFRIERAAQTITAVNEVEFSALGLPEKDFSALNVRESEIQGWVAAHPAILGDDLMMVTREFAWFDRTYARVDLEAVDREGSLVIIELKRDDSGSDVHWQAIKYASFFTNATAEDVTRWRATHEKIEPSEAESQLVEHLNTGDLDDLNRRQRIILASHRFSPEVTSAALWLNDQAGTDLITCVELIPYCGQDTSALYLQAKTILPALDTKALRIGIGSRVSEGEDEITRFMKVVDEEAMQRLDFSLRPNKRNTKATRDSYARIRKYELWYLTDPWDGNNTRFIVLRYDESGKILVAFRAWKPNLKDKEPKLEERHFSDLEARLKEIEAELIDESEDQFSVSQDDKKTLELGVTFDREDLDDALREKVVTALVKLIEAVKPAFDAWVAEWDEN